jgi:DNA recombination protein RmuC
MLLRRERAAAGIDARLSALEVESARTAEAVRGDLSRAREESTVAAREARAELSASLSQLTGRNEERLENLRRALEENLARLQEQQRISSKETRDTLEQRFERIQKDNSEKLEQMRQTVDEKLHATLEQRLSESFKQVSDRLEMVHKGLGEMHALASDVGDLKKVLTNVKTRGGLGEVQLAALLEQILVPEQYATNVATRPGSKDRVEFAIRLPGQDTEHPVWLPLDAKFPTEDYQRLQDAQEAADPARVEAAAKALESRVRLEARTIAEKYIESPYTTDFGLLYLPMEGLYAEVLRRPGLFESLQRDHHVIVCGPTTLAALLSSLQMGFRTLAIEKRSSEVWKILGAVKSEFGRFGDVLANTKKQLQTVANSIDQAETRTRQIERKLKDVESLPAPPAGSLPLALPDIGEAGEA